MRITKKKNELEIMDIYNMDTKLQSTANLLNYNIGYYGSCYYKQPLYYTNIYAWIEKSKQDRCKNIVEKARQLKQNGQDEEYKALKETLPCTMYTCHTNESKSSKDIKDLLPFIVIDIDHLDENEVEETKNKLFALPYVFLVSKSVSGLGVYALAYIAYPEKAKETYRSLVIDMAKIGIEIDKQCNNINRLRFMSYDENLLVKENDMLIEPYSKYVEPTSNLKCKESKKSVDSIVKSYDGVNIELLHKAVKLMIEDGYHVNSYGAWYHLASELKNFDDGLELFIKSSSNPQYNDSEEVIIKKWEKAEPSGITPDLSRKWMGMAKNRFGKDWWKISNNNLFTTNTL